MKHLISKFLKILKKHWPAIILAILVGSLFLSYHIFVIDFLGGEEYQPSTLETRYDITFLYAPRVAEILSGEITAGDVSLYEYQNGPAILPILNPFVMALLAKITGSLNKALIFSDFVFPALLYILVYILILEITKKRHFSLISSFIFIFSPGIGAFNQYFLTKPPIPRFDFGRFESPQITFIFLILAMYFIYRAITIKNKSSIILAGLCSGLLFYTYFYDWMYIFVGLFLMFAIFLLQKKIKNVKIIIQIGVIALVVSIPYWINFFAISGLPQYKDITARIGMEISHQFRSANWRAYLRHIFIAILVWLAFSKKQKILASYLVAFLLPLLILLNLQVLTGFNPQPDHWVRTHWVALYISILALFLWLYEKYFKKIPKKYFIMLGYSAIAAISIITLQLYTNISSTHYNEHRIDSQILESYEWLNKNTPKNSVVGSISHITNAELLVYTKNKIFLPYGLNTLAPSDEIWKRYFYTGKLFNLPEKEFSESISGTHDMLMHLFHGQYYVNKSLNSFFKKNKRKLPEKLFEKTMNDYKELLNKPDNIIIPYKLDYIYLGPRERGLAENIKISHPDIDKVYDKDYIVIYKYGK